MMRVLVTGGRDFRATAVLRELMSLDREHGPFDTIIHGGYGNTDLAAGRWAAMQKRIVEPFYPDWKKLGPAAGPIRNQRMLDEGKPDLVIVFPGGRGTADMKSRALDAGVEVIQVGCFDPLSEDQQNEFEERAAIMQFEGGMPKEQAEAEAMKRTTRKG